MAKDTDLGLLRLELRSTAQRKRKRLKGEVKKGKGKGKGPKGNWGFWGTEGKDKPGDKPKKGEGET